VSDAVSIRVFAEHRRGREFIDETKRVAAHVLLKERRKATVSVVFVDDGTITDLNKRFLGHDYTTDVLSFPIDEENGVVEGEVYVNVDQAERQAAEYAVPVRQELCRLVIHGVLHLVGYTDRTGEERAGMRSKEDSYLKSLELW
jgi:probable rRNA maturation factor